MHTSINYLPKEEGGGSHAICGQRHSWSATTSIAQSNCLDLGWNTSCWWSSQLGPPSLLALGECQNVADIRALPNALCPWQSCCTFVQANASATSTCESPRSSTTESATADGILLWVSKGKLLPYWWVLLFSTMFHFDNSGERLVGACSHCATALSLAAVIPGNPGQFTTTHRGVRLLDRKNPEQMDISTAAEVS